MKKFNKKIKLFTNTINNLLNSSNFIQNEYHLGIGIGISPALKRSFGSSLSDYVFKALTLNIAGVSPRDGTKIVEFNGEAHLLGGWDPSQRYNTHYKTTDGITFTSVATMNFAIHTFCADVFNNGTEIWTWGGDVYLNANPVQKYTTAGGWVTISADVSGSGFGTRFLYGGCKHVINGVEYMYACAGQIDATGVVILYDVVRASISNPTNWTTIGSFPTGNYSTGTLLSYNGSLIFLGGGKYTNGTNSNYNSLVLESTDNGATWNVLPNVLPTELLGIWQNAEIFDNKIFIIKGVTTTNQNGIFYTADKGANWTQLYDSPQARHASGFSKVSNKLTIITGNFWNDSYQITKENYTNALSSGISAYYGVWKNTGYTGACLRAKNTTTLVEQDINFVDGYVDTASLLTLAGANSVTVQFYDQSGNVNHQTNFSGLIVTSGVLNTTNGKASVYYSGSENFTIAPLSLGTKYSVFMVVNIVSQNREFIGGGTNNYMIYHDTTAHYVSNNSSVGSSSGQFLIGSQSIISFLRDDKIVQVYQLGINGGNRDFNPMELSSNNSFTITDLMGEGSPYLFQGTLQLVVMYNTNKLNNKKGIENYINSLL